MSLKHLTDERLLIRFCKFASRPYRRTKSKAHLRKAIHGMIRINNAMNKSYRWTKTCYVCEFEDLSDDNEFVKRLRPTTSIRICKNCLNEFEEWNKRNYHHEYEATVSNHSVKRAKTSLP